MLPKYGKQSKAATGVGSSSKKTNGKGIWLSKELSKCPALLRENEGMGCTKTQFNDIKIQLILLFKTTLNTQHIYFETHLKQAI